MAEKRFLSVKSVWTDWSASKLKNIFDCQLSAFLWYVLRVPAPIHPYTALGQALHFMFYLFFKKSKKTDDYFYRELDLDKFLRIFKGFWWGAVEGIEHGYGSFREPPVEVFWEFPNQSGVLFQQGNEVLERFHADFIGVRQDENQHWVEIGFTFPLERSGLVVRGKIDRLDIIKMGQGDENGSQHKVVILDYKPSRYSTPLLETDVQPTIYQLAYKMYLQNQPWLNDQLPLDAITIHNYRNGQSQAVPLRPQEEFELLIYHLLQASAYLKGVITARPPHPYIVPSLGRFNSDDIKTGDVTLAIPRSHPCRYCGYYVNQKCQDWLRSVGRRPTAREMFWERYGKARIAQRPSQTILPIREVPVVRETMANLISPRVKEIAAEQLSLHC